jgi:putative transposase
MSKWKYNPDFCHRRSVRLQDRDYNAASAYFITLCADRPEPIFEIPELRKILTETWQALPVRFPNVSLDEFVIMPDHIHFILWLHRSQEATPTLGRVIGTYKSLAAVTWLNHIKSNNLECSGRIWHRNYYERVVRIAELEQTRQYIRENPTKPEQRYDSKYAK